MVILRTYYEIDASSAVHDLCAFGLRDASGNGNNHSGTALCFRHLETSHQAKLRIHLFRCLFSDMTSIEDYQIRILWPLRLRKAEWRQKICHTHRVVDIHLAAKGLDIDTPRDAVFRACDRGSCHRACATRPRATRWGGHGAAVPASAAAAQTVLRQVRQRCGHSNSSQGPFANHNRKEMLAGGILPPLRRSRGRSCSKYEAPDRRRHTMRRAAGRGVQWACRRVGCTRSGTAGRQRGKRPLRVCSRRKEGVFDGEYAFAMAAGPLRKQDQRIADRQSFAYRVALRDGAAYSPIHENTAL